ncbi:hypothetical protein E3N88_43812 [Mikania micrantha]|uniref:30S ribosomal protein S16, chloroplastic n=1 Tax=Mikania micrantha TaxID=192012 RepID=A0A5N6LDV0_9ASTR|nr:hypothetical protein E3N88_43812 [Mikania micrantha]
MARDVGIRLKRTGKSCRLRWLNYLKPDVKHGNLTPQEQLLILELHSKWGNSSLQSNAYFVENNNFDIMSFNHSNTPEFRTNDTSALEFQMAEVDWMSQDLVDDTFWNMDELWQFKK